MTCRSPKDVAIRTQYRLGAMERLSHLGTGLLLEKDLHSALEKILASALELLGGERGTVQLLDHESQQLGMAAHRGFTADNPPPCKPLETNGEPAVQCRCANPGSTPGGGACPAACFSQVAIPLTSRNGERLGYITACFRQPIRPTRLQLRLLDLYAQQASAFIEHMQVQQALRGSEAYLSTLFTNAPVGLSEISLDGRFERVNRALCDMLGMSEEALLNASIADITEAADLPASMAAVQRVLQTGEVASIDKTYVRPDGGRVPANSILNRLLDEWGRPRAILAVTVDLSERKRAEEARLHSEQRYRTLAELSPIGILVVCDSVVTYANPASLSMLGAESADQIHDGAAWQPVDPALALFSSAFLASLIHADPHSPAERTWQRLDGKPVRVELWAAPVMWQDDAATIVLLRNVTQRRLAEEALRKSEERYRTLFESIEEGFVLLEPVYSQAENGGKPCNDTEPADFWIAEVNPAFEMQTGLGDVTGRTVCQVAWGSEKFWMRYFGRIFSEGGSERRVFYSRRLLRWLSVNAFAVGANGNRRIAVLFSNITEQKRIQDELAISNDRLKLAIEGAGDGVWDWDLDTDRISVSRRWAEMLGYRLEELGDHVSIWQTRVHSDDIGRVLGEMQDCLDARAPSFVSEFRMRRKDGDYLWVLARGIVVRRSLEGRPLRVTGMMSDISARKEADETIWRHANFDTLTGLPNRRLFRDRLEHEVRKAQRAQTQLAVLFIDLDRFKQVNDLLGHDVGDQLLQQASQRLRSCVRESDTVARLGGDEFTIIMSQLDDPDHVEHVSQKILDALSRPFSLGREVSYLSGSVGVTLYPADASTAEELIRKADQAMYAAKNGGKNRFSYFTESMDRYAHLRLRLASELRSALSQQQFEVYYQPVIELANGRIAKAEALLRWHHPRLGMVQPTEFIPVAEESGAINQIGDWVFRQAAACSKKWGKLMGRPFQIGVNRSPAQFLSGTGEDPVACLRQLGLSGDSISVEITEGLLLHASERVTDRLLEFRDAGVQVAIDDFGTGYSSMAYLKRFDIDFLKIDQSFVQDMEHDESNRTIAESIIVMAHRLGLKVIAEGIETAGQHDLLRAAGCDYGQGFFFSEAVPPAEFEQLLERVTC